VTYAANAAIGKLLFGFLVYRSTDGLPVYDANFGTAELRTGALRAGDQLVIDFHFSAHLTRGQYHLGCHVYDEATHTYTDRVCPTGILSVDEDRTHSGIADLDVSPAVVRPMRASITVPHAVLQHSR
jgi:hypothetical protein